ncbi:MAG: hypothetical protein KW788_00065 [Candidatus Doudnabacteria bacterium]|nr:hypothetical protein [Candidatus Doudnabacteria bacterium]
MLYLLLYQGPRRISQHLSMPRVYEGGSMIRGSPTSSPTHDSLPVHFTTTTDNIAIPDITAADARGAGGA